MPEGAGNALRHRQITTSDDPVRPQRLAGRHPCNAPGTRPATSSRPARSAGPRVSSLRAGRRRMRAILDRIEDSVWGDLIGVAALFAILGGLLYLSAGLS